MKQEEMLNRLEDLKTYCEEEGWEADAQALEYSINIIGYGYLDDFAYIKDMIAFLFIFVGILVIFEMFILCG